MYIVMFSPVFHLWIIKCHSNTKKMRYYLLISDKYKGFKLANRKSQLNLKAMYEKDDRLNKTQTQFQELQIYGFF